LRWRGLNRATDAGTPPALLLALPALPAMLAQARYLGSAPVGPRDSTARRLHLFAAAVTIAGHPIECWLIVRQNRLGRLFFQHLLPQDPPAVPRQVGGGTPDADGSDPSSSSTDTGDAVTEPAVPTTDVPAQSSSSEPPQSRVPVYEPRPPDVGWEKLPPGDARDAAAHGYDLDEWLALKRGEPWVRPAAPPLPGFWTRLGRGLAKDAEQSFGGNYGLSLELYQALGGDDAPLTRWITAPAAKAIDFLANPRRGPAFLVNAATRTAAELGYSAGLSSEEPERAKGEFDGALRLLLLGAGIQAPEAMPFGVESEALGADRAAAELSTDPVPREATSEDFASRPDQPAVDNASANASVPNSGSAAAPTYSVAYTTRLGPKSLIDSRDAHYQKANEALLQNMEQDPDFAKSMRDIGVVLERTPTGLAPRKPPPGWSWHHALTPGEMQLVPRDQHESGSTLFRALHPTPRGGYATWGKQ
jgi:hypothetical protein